MLSRAVLSSTARSLGNKNNWYNVSIMNEKKEEKIRSSREEYQGEVSSTGSLISIVIIIGVIMVGGAYYLFLG